MAVQAYPRISEPDSKEQGLLNIENLKPLPQPIGSEVMKTLIAASIKAAELKTNKRVLEITDDMSPNAIKAAFKKEGKSLFTYFKRPDPASIANYLFSKDCESIAREFIKKRKTHLDSMNAGWRYQYLFVECAQKSNRFKSVSDLSTGDSDVNIMAETIDGGSTVSIYISMKNRKDTISGGSGAAVLKKLENVAKTDRNRIGPYCCVIALGMQTQRHRGRTKHSPNIEFWPSNFLWPLVSGHSYKDIMFMTSQALSETRPIELEVPDEVIQEFRTHCKRKKLINSDDIFDNKENIINWLCT